MGINRVKRRAQRLRRRRAAARRRPRRGLAGSAVDDPLSPLEFAIGRLTGLPCEPGNKVEMLRSGDEAYPRMLAAIADAQKSVGLASYIFRDDKAGKAFHQALIQAQRRGVEVRVLIDGVGGGYFWSGTYNELRSAGVPVARFLHSYFPWRMPFVNLRNHRKVHGHRRPARLHRRHQYRRREHPRRQPASSSCSTPTSASKGRSSSSSPTPSPTTGCITTGEKLLTESWFPPLEKAGPVTARVVTSGPDEDMEQIEFVALHAISCARKSIRVVTPYFLPPDPLTMALGLAALRGVMVDIVLPEHSNHAILDWARRVPLRPLIEAGCRVWLSRAPFDHSKLMVIDESWALIGSANWDTRSFRLNFELNVELHDPDFARDIAADRPLEAPAHAGRARQRSAAGPSAQQRRTAAAALSVETALADRGAPVGRCSAVRGPRRTPLVCRPQPSAMLSSSRIGRWSDGPKASASAARQARPCTRQRSSRNGMTLLAKCVGSRGPTSLKPGSRTEPHHIEVADDRRRLAAQRGGDARELAAVQELAVREMDVGEGDVAHLHELRPPPRQASGQARGGQRQRARRGEAVRAPYRQAVHAPEPRQPMEVAADQRRQRLDMLRRLLHQHQVGLLLSDQGGHVLDGRAGEAQQVPADDFQTFLTSWLPGRGVPGGSAR